MKYTTEIQKAQFDEQGLATIAGWVEVYLCDPMTREYVRASLDNVPLGGSVVADAYLDKPELPTKSHVAIIRSEDNQSWLHVSDNRGKVAYNTETQAPMMIDFIGDLPNELTLLEPKTEFDKWDGKKWVTDIEAQKAVLISQANNEKSQRLTEANNQIDYLQDSVDLDMASPEEAELLAAWRKYRILINKIDTSLTPNIEWPERPAIK